MSETYHCARCGSKDIYYYPAVNPNDKVDWPLIEEIMMYAECACNECGYDHCVDHGEWLDICKDRKKEETSDDKTHTENHLKLVHSQSNVPKPTK